MTAGALTGVTVLVVLVAGVMIVHLFARSRAAPRQVGAPDATTDDVVSGLMAELRKWQAEAAHWKATAERLQRDLDGRRYPAPATGEEGEE